MRRLLSTALASFALACAQTTAPASGGGTSSADTATSETASGSETTTGKDTTTTGDTATTDTTATTGGVKTIAEIQQHESSKTCPDPNKQFGGPANGKGTQLKSAIVASAVIAGSLDGMYVQTEGGGAWNGLYVVATKGKLADVKQGDVVSLIGEVKEYYCLTELDVKDLPPVVEKQGTGLATAVTVDVDVIGEKGKPEERESYESVLVTIENVVVSEPLADKNEKTGKYLSMYVGKTDADKTLLITAGFGNYPQDKDNKPNYQKGQKLNVKGFLDFSFGAYKIRPLNITVQ
jgi:predicted extracellular nuclease